MLPPSIYSTRFLAFWTESEGAGSDETGKTGLWVGRLSGFSGYWHSLAHSLNLGTPRLSSSDFRLLLHRNYPHLTRKRTAMSDLTKWNLILGFLMPLLIAAIQQPKFPKWGRATVMVAASIIGGGLTAYLSGQVTDWSDVLGGILTLGVASITFYHGFWKPTGAAQVIESKTNVRSSSAPGE